MITSKQLQNMSRCGGDVDRIVLNDLAVSFTSLKKTYKTVLLITGREDAKARWPSGI